MWQATSIRAWREMQGDYGKKNGDRLLTMRSLIIKSPMIMAPVIVLRVHGTPVIVMFVIITPGVSRGAVFPE